MQLLVRQGSRNAKTTAASRVGQSPNPLNDRTREAHLQHPQEDSCNQDCDDNKDYPRTRLFDELTRLRQREPRARRLARGRLEVVLVLSMLFSKSPISPAPVRANRRKYTKTAHAPQCDLRCNYGAEKLRHHAHRCGRPHGADGMDATPHMSRQKSAQSRLTLSCRHPVLEHPSPPSPPHNTASRPSWKRRGATVSETPCHYPSYAIPNERNNSRLRQ